VCLTPEKTHKIMFRVK